jgi:hypothetical protein
MVPLTSDQQQLSQPKQGPDDRRPEELREHSNPNRPITVTLWESMKRCSQSQSLNWNITNNTANHYLSMGISEMVSQRESLKRSG